MHSNKRIGFLILVGGPILMAAYALGIVYFAMQVLQLTALLVFLGVMVFVTWVGYTMFTEPPPPQANSHSDLDDLQPETIHAAEENETVSKSKFSIITKAEVGEGTIVRDHVNLFKCKIGKNCKIESFVYIEEGVVIGDNCKIKPYVFIPTGVTIEDDVFVGPNVAFTNDKYPRVKGDWTLLKTFVGRGSSIGANTVILPGVRIGRNVMVGAGSVVTSNIPDDAVVSGNPARLLVK